MPKSQETLAEDDLRTLLHELPEWGLEKERLVRCWKFNNFREAITFVNQVAAVAEAAGHHPDIDIRYNRVQLALVSHDAGGITARDAAMARRLTADFPPA